MLKKEGKITDAVIENMMSWHHSGFHVHIGERIQPDNEQGLENLARYVVRACFSQERMVYIPVEESTGGTAKVIYTSETLKIQELNAFQIQIDSECDSCLFSRVPYHFHVW